MKRTTEVCARRATTSVVRFTDSPIVVLFPALKCGLFSWRPLRGCPASYAGLAREAGEKPAERAGECGPGWSGFCETLGITLKKASLRSGRQKRSRDKLPVARFAGFLLFLPTQGSARPAPPWATLFRQLRWLTPARTQDATFLGRLRGPTIRKAKAATVAALQMDARSLGAS